MNTYRKEPGHHLPGMDDGWAIFGKVDADSPSELLAVVDTETIADRIIGVLSGEGDQSLARQLYDLMWPEGDEDGPITPDTVDEICRLVRAAVAVEGAGKVYAAFVDTAVPPRRRPEPHVKTFRSRAEADAFVDGVAWVNDDSTEFLGLFTDERAARRAAGIRVSGDAPNVRFWTYAWGLYPVRIELEPDQRVTITRGGPTDEGYFGERESWHYDSADAVVYAERETDGRDCDGRHETYGAWHCPVDELEAGRPIQRENGDADGDLRQPQWYPGKNTVRDDSAEAAGY